MATVRYGDVVTPTKTLDSSKIKPLQKEASDVESSDETESVQDKSINEPKRESV